MANRRASLDQDGSRPGPTERPPYTRGGMPLIPGRAGCHGDPNGLEHEKRNTI